jgi:DNA primase
MPIEYQDVIEKLSGVCEYADYSAAICPSHPDTKPSLLVFKDGHFRCLACGFHGTYHKLLEKLEGWVAPPIIEYRKDYYKLPTDMDELEILVDDANRFLLSHLDPLGNYLTRRKISGRIKPQNLGYWNGWYTIPIYSERKQFLGVVLRAGTHIQNETGARFHIPHGQPALLYVPDWKLVNESEYLVVVFGMVDALALCDIGVPACTSTSGKDSTKAEMFDKFRKKIIILPDKDEEHTALRLVSGLGWRGSVSQIPYPSDCKDPADLIQNGYEEIIFGITKESK